MKYSVSKSKLKVIYRSLQNAANNGDFKLYRRCQALVGIFDIKHSFDEIAILLQISVKTIERWLKDYISDGIRSLKIAKPKGRKTKLSLEQQKELKKALNGSPSDFGYNGGCWNAVILCDLIKKRFKISYSVKYLPQMLKKLGFSYQKAKFLLNKASRAKRKEWLENIWPDLLEKAQSEQSLLLFEDEASFALWGSLSYTWSKRGKQPLIATNGNRKSTKVFGAIDYFSGKLFYRVVEGKLNGKTYIDFLKMICKKAESKVILIHDGARYHTCKEVKSFCKENSEKLTLVRLPSYSPDFNPIEGLWRKIKRGYTHNVYFENFEQLVGTVKKALNSIVRRRADILNLFGFYTDSNA